MVLNFIGFGWEYWFYLHFNSSGNFSNKCNAVISKLKKLDDIFKDYDKSSKQIKFIAASLKMKINTAYKNSKIEVVIWKI